METATKIYSGLGGIVALFSIVGSLWFAGNLLATDVELQAVAVAAETATQVVVDTHARDKVTQAEADKNDRVDRVDRDIRKLKRLIEFGDPAEKAYNQSELVELRQLKQNILDGKR